MLRAQLVDQRVADSGQIEITALGQVFELVEKLRWMIERKQAGLFRTQLFLQALCEINGNLPVRTRFTRCGNGLADVGNPPL